MVKRLFVAAALTSAFLLCLANVRAEAMDCRPDNNGRMACSDNPVKVAKRAAPNKRVRHASYVKTDANGNSLVRSSSGVVVRVAPSARAALQCVVDAVEAAGVRIKSMRGYGAGTVRASLHPSGRAIDINQTARNVTHPHVPRAVSNAAADKCGVISGARWGYADNGHWNLSMHGRAQEPWPRVAATR